MKEKIGILYCWFLKKNSRLCFLRWRLLFNVNLQDISYAGIAKNFKNILFAFFIDILIWIFRKMSRISFFVWSRMKVKVF